MPALEKVNGVIRALQTSMMILLTKIVRNWVDWVVSLGPGRVSAGGYISVPKIQTEKSKNGR